MLFTNACLLNFAKFFLQVTFFKKKNLLSFNSRTNSFPKEGNNSIRCGKLSLKDLDETLELKKMLIWKKSPTMSPNRWTKYYIYFRIEAQKEEDWSPYGTPNGADLHAHDS